jgi:hypothetical protein
MHTPIGIPDNLKRTSQEERSDIHIDLVTTDCESYRPPTVSRHHTLVPLLSCLCLRKTDEARREQNDLFVVSRCDSISV